VICLSVIASVWSYGGMLSAYMRFRYPNIITGSIAASAPILLVAGDSSRESFFQDVSAVCDYMQLSICFCVLDWNIILFLGGFSLRAKEATASAHLSHRNSVHLSVRPSVTRVDQSKMVQARITKSSPSAAWKTLVLGTVKLFHKFNEESLWTRVLNGREGRKNLRFLVNKSLYLINGAR